MSRLTFLSGTFWGSRKADWRWVHDFRFLLAAGGGAVIGLAGISLAGAVPALGLVAGIFFAGLPYLALPFISLSIFRAFSEKSMLKEAGTLARFAVMMAAGFLISLGVTAAMAGFLPLLDPNATGTALSTAASIIGSLPFNPAQYIMHGLAAGAVFGSCYRIAQQKIANNFPKAAGPGQNKLSRAFNVASDAAINKHTAPLISKAGKGAEKLASGTDKLFGHYMNFIGIPAIVVLMSGALAGGAIPALAAYGAYYATIFTSMAVAYAGLIGLGYFRYGMRRKEFNAMAKVAVTALGTSSSVATMPVAKDNLRAVGMPDNIVNAVIPLGANFNMFGTALYLGGTAAAALVMFGITPTLPVLLMVGAVTVLTGFGTPGMPSSNIILLDTVLQKTGLTPPQSAKIYEMVLPGDRILDMFQTTLNVIGDCVIAFEVWRDEKKAIAAPKRDEGNRWGNRLIGPFRAAQAKKPPANNHKPAAAAPKAA